MFIQFTRKNWVATVLLLLTAGALYACAFPGNYQPSINTLSLAHQGLSLAVWLEDQCESHESDERRVTLLESLHHGLSVPIEMLFTVGVVTVLGTAWSLYDRVTVPVGEPLPNRPQAVLEYVKPHRAGPKFDSRRHGPDVPIAWLGCLSIYGDG